MEQKFRIYLIILDGTSEYNQNGINNLLLNKLSIFTYMTTLTVTTSEISYNISYGSLYLFVGVGSNYGQIVAFVGSGYNIDQTSHIIKQNNVTLNVNTFGVVKLKLDQGYSTNSIQVRVYRF